MNATILININEKMNGSILNSVNIISIKLAETEGTNIFDVTPHHKSKFVL